MATTTTNMMLAGTSLLGTDTTTSITVSMLSNKLLNSTLLNSTVGDCKRARLDDMSTAATIRRRAERTSTENSLLGETYKPQNLKSSLNACSTGFLTQSTGLGLMTANSILSSSMATSSILPSVGSYTSSSYDSTPSTTAPTDVDDDEQMVADVDNILTTFGEENVTDDHDFAAEEEPKPIKWTIKPDDAKTYEIRLKTQFLRQVSMALVHAGNMTNKNDDMRNQLIDYVDQLDGVDPEFVLKTILYTRTTLNIRTIANFLMACAATMPSCKSFIRKYFCKSIVIPSDMIEVADMYATFEEKRTGAEGTRFPLPVCLRKAMCDKFPEFDEYQIAKHNKAGKRKRKPKSKTAKPSRKSAPKKDSRPQRVAKEIPKDAMTLKKLVRQLHLRLPAELVMAIIGKKYPSTQNQFYQSGLLGTWDESRAGKRIKLKVPETWETQVSLHGNKASVWEKLIDNKKLPFMAMLRNLRNLIKSGISESHKKMVLKRLRDERQVINSRQFPFRFFSAYQALNDLETALDEYDEIVETAINVEKISVKANPTHNKKKKAEIKKDNEKRRERILAKGIEYTKEILDEYRSALDDALRLATKHNIAPIAGQTLVICDANGTDEIARAKSIGVVDKTRELSLLFGLLCEQACEQSTVVSYKEGRVTPITMRGQGKKTILKHMSNIIGTMDEVDYSRNPGQQIHNFLATHLNQRTRFDSIVVFGEASEEMEEHINYFLRAYRGSVNENVIYISVDVCSSKPSTPNSSHPNNVKLAGISDQILRYIAERGNTAQIDYVQGIDVKHELINAQQPAKKPRMKNECSAAIERTQPEPAMIDRLRTKSIRIFISSTFNDMHFERATVMRHVLPHLQHRLPTNYVLHCVDLRWGVPEAKTTSTASVMQCLREAARADILLVLLGHRYGFRPKTEVLDQIAKENTDIQWLSDKLNDRLSITELECISFFKDQRDKPAVCLTRFDEFLDTVPKEKRTLVESAKPELRQKLLKFKDWLLMTGVQCDEYDATFIKAKKNTPIVGGLSQFARMALDSLQESVEVVIGPFYISPTTSIDTDPMLNYHCRQVARMQTLTESIVGRDSLIARAAQFVSKRRHVRVVGGTGQGVTTVISAIAQRANKTTVVVPCLENATVAEFVDYATSVLHCAVYEKEMRTSVTINSSVDGIRGYADKLDDIGMSVLFVVDSTELGMQLVDVADALTEKTNISWLTTACLHENARVITVSALNVEQRKQIVRHRLAIVGKQMQENTFANHLSHLIMKRDASNLQYVQLACDYLVAHSAFTTIATDIREMASTLPQLAHDIIAKMSSESAGNVVTNVLCILALVGSTGVPCTVLREMVGMIAYFESNKKATLSDIDNYNSFNMRTDAAVNKMMRGVQLLTRLDGAVIRLKSAWIGDTICAKFMLPERLATNARRINVLKAIASVSMRHLDDDWNGHVHFATHLNNVTKALMLAKLDKSIDLIERIRNNDQLLVNAVTSRSTVTLTKVVANISTNVTVDNNLRVKMERLLQFLRLNCQLLMRYPQLLEQQAINGGMKCGATSVMHEMLLTSTPTSAVAHHEFNVNQSVSTLVTFDYNHCRHVIVGLSNGCLRLINTVTGEMSAETRAHAAPITAMTIVGEETLVTGAHDGSMTLWTVNATKLVILRQTNLQSHRVCVSAITPFLWDTRTKACISVGWDGVIRQMAPMQGMKTTTTVTTSSPINCVATMSNRPYSLTGHWDGSLKLYDLSRSQRKGVWFGHKGAVRAVIFTQDDRQAVTADIFGELRVWSTAHGTTVGTFNASTSVPITRIVALDNGARFASTAQDGTVTVWKSALGRQLDAITCVDRQIVSSVATSKTLTAVATTDGNISFFKRNGESSQIGNIYTKKMLECESIITIKMVSGGKSLAVATDNAVVTIDLTDFSVRQRTCTLQHGKPVDMAVADHALALLFSNGGVTFVDSPTVPETLCFGHDDKVTSVAISADGNEIATVGKDRAMVIYHQVDGVTTVKHVIRQAHDHDINTVAFVEGKQLLVTGSSDCSVKVWTIGDDTLTMATHITCHHSPVIRMVVVRNCVISADSSNIVCISSVKGSLVTQFTFDDAVTDLALDLHTEPPAANEEMDWAEAMDETNAQVVDATTARRDARDAIMQDVTLVVGTHGPVAHAIKPFIGDQVVRLTVGSSAVGDAVCDKDCFITGNNDGVVRLTNMSTVDGEDECKQLHSARIAEMAMNHNQRCLLSIDVEGLVGLSMRDHTETTTVQVSKPGVQCEWLDNERFVVLHGSADISIFSVSDWLRPRTSLERTTRCKRVHSLTALPSSQSILTNDWENQLCQLSGTFEKLSIDSNVLTTIQNLEEPVTHLESLAGDVVWAGFIDGLNQTHECNSLPFGQLTMLLTRNVTSMVVVDSHHRYVLMGTTDGQIVMYDRTAEEKLMEVMAHNGPVIGLKYLKTTENGDVYVCSLGNDRMMKLWKIVDTLPVTLDLLTVYETSGAPTVMVNHYNEIFVGDQTGRITKITLAGGNIRG